MVKNIDIVTILGFSGIFFFLFLIAEFGYHRLKINVNYTRKFVHIMTGIIVMFFPIYFKKPIDLIIICSSFFIVLALSKRLGMMKSINAIDRMSRGSTLYPVVVVLCYLIQYYWQNYMYFVIPILILALADPAAEFFGKRYGYGPFSVFNHKKTISGSTGFFIIALITSFLALYYLSEVQGIQLILIAGCIAIFTTIGEAVSIKGYDNLVIPICAVVVLYLFGF